MPFKLIGTIILLVLVTIFCGFNLENKCDINLVFYKFKDVSVFLTVMVSFFAGILLTLPFTLFKKKMTKEQIHQASEKLKVEEQKKALKIQKEKQKLSDKEKADSQKQEKLNKKEEEKTIFDFKIRRPIKEKVVSKTEKDVPKVKTEDKENKEEKTENLQKE